MAPESAMSNIILSQYVEHGHVIFAQNICLEMLVAAYYPDCVITRIPSW